MATDGALERVVAALTEGFEPLIEALSAPPPGAGLIQLALEVGVDLSAVLDANSAQTVEAAINEAYNVVLSITENPDGFADQIPEALKAIRDLKAAIRTLDALLANPADLALKLFSYLVFRNVERKAPPLHAALMFAGVFKSQSIPASGAVPAYDTREIVWEQFPALVSPGDLLRNLYGWGSGTLDSNLMLTRIENLLWSIGIPTVYRGGESPGTDGVIDLTWGLAFDGVMMPLGLEVAYLPPTSDPPGLSVAPQGTLSFSQTLQVSSGWELDVALNASAAGGYGLFVRPGADVALGALPGQPPVTWTLQGAFELKRVATDGGNSIVIFGAPDSSRLEAAALGFKAIVQAGSAHNDLGLEFNVSGGKVVVSTAESDGFLKNVLPQDGLSLDFDFGLGWSKARGLYFNGDAGLEASFPVHVELGPVTLDTLFLSLAAAGTQLKLEASVAAEAELGPLAASVEGVGLLATAEFVKGDLDFTVAFKPPKGVGLALDAGVVQGGGFLYIDTARGEYAGALELMVADWLQLTAIGLISTKMPDGSNGFSLLVIITAQFGTGLQLGFGFTLIGVGGLLGLNRTMLFQPLMDGVRTGAINGILFPTDVVANAPKIISDLKAIFPPKKDTFLIGPMAKLGWGTPTLISASLGVIIEIPPADIAILGIIQLALPDPDDVILLLQVNFAGALEFDKKRLYFFASLYDSRIVFITIQGEMGLLVAYGSDANFVLSVGGFHPQFNPPPLPFPSPNRVQLDIINESYARIRADGYFAVTSNTAQVGAHAEYFFGFSAVSVTGHSGFDALFQFSPFYFIVEGSTAFSANVFGVGVYGLDIDLTLSGPTPWHAHGTASISFLFFSIGIGIDITFGDSRDTSLPLIVVMSILVTEFGKSTNWQAQLPAGSNLSVSLRQLDPSDTTLVLHPVGTLRVSQRAVPLDLSLDKVGNQAPSDANRFHLDVSPGGLAKNQDLNEPFAPAQFRNFSDADKLSQAAYTPQHSGVELAASGSSYATGTAITRNVRYDLTVIDTQYRRYLKPFFVYLTSLFLHFLGGASVARNAFSAATLNQMQPWGQKITVSSETFAVANLSDNRAYSAGSVGFSSRVSAQDYLNRTLAAQPSLTGALHILGQHELTP